MMALLKVPPLLPLERLGVSTCLVVFSDKAESSIPSFSPATWASQPVQHVKQLESPLLQVCSRATSSMLVSTSVSLDQRGLRDLWLCPPVIHLRIHPTCPERLTRISAYVNAPTCPHFSSNSPLLVAGFL